MSHNDAEKVKERIDIVQYVQRFTPDLKRAGRHYKACCPFHSEKTPSFTVNPATQTWHCYGACAEGGDVLAFAQKRNNWTFGEAIQALAKEAGIELTPPSREQVAKDAQSAKLLGLMTTATEFYQAQLQANTPQSALVRRYLEQTRGLSAETVQAWQLGYAPDGWQTLTPALLELGYAETDLIALGLSAKSDKNAKLYDVFRNRLMIPIRDDRGRVVGFGARILKKGDTPKYLNSPQSVVFDKSALLFGLDKAKSAIREQSEVVIVEGYMDVIQAHQAGFQNVVAQMGTALTEAQISRVKRYTNRVIVALDADSAGQTATRKSVDVIRKQEVDVAVLTIPQGKDPDDLIRHAPEAWANAVKEAPLLMHWLIDYETSTLPTAPSTVQIKALVNRLAPNWSEGLERAVWLKNIALRLNLREDALEGIVTASVTVPKGNKPNVDAPITDLEGAFLASILNDVILCAWTTRQFNKLANGSGNNGLKEFGLHPVHPYDFEHPKAKVIMHAFIGALSQDEQDFIEYVLERVPDARVALQNSACTENVKDLVTLGIRLRLRYLERKIPEVAIEGNKPYLKCLLMAKALLQKTLKHGVTVD